MTEDSQTAAEERRIAHTGTLAKIAGRCARHPWRVVGGWLVTMVVLIGLNAAFHGKLVNDFNIPGSDAQKAVDLINAKFGGQKGAALRVVVAAPPGQRLDTPEREAAIRKMLAAGTVSQHAIDQKQRDVSAITDPLATSSHQLSKDGRIGFFDVQYDQTGFQIPRSGIVNVEDKMQAIGAPAGIDVQFTGDAENAPPTQGLSDIIGLIAGLHHPDGAVPGAGAGRDPAALRGHGGHRGVPDPLPGGPLHPLQHDHRDPGADDRAGRRHRLHAVHRHPIPAIPARRPVVAGRGSRRRRHRRPGRALRRDDGRHLDHRACASSASTSSPSSASAARWAC